MTTHFVSLATNKYRFLGERLRDLLARRYKSNYQLHVFSETPIPGTVWHERHHRNWLAAVSDKYPCLLSLDIHEDDYVFYVDADTGELRDFSIYDIEGEVVAAQHFADQAWMKQSKNYDRNPASSCYVPVDTPLPQMWYMGAFHGGRWSRMKPLYQRLQALQLLNQSIGHEPGVNDESYLNYYFHYHPPTRVLHWPEGFPFVVSDKGGHACLRSN